MTSPKPVASSNCGTIIVVPGMIIVTMMKPNSSCVALDLNLPSTNAIAEDTAAARATVDSDTTTEFRKFR